MHIGILQCDDVREELIAEFGNYPEMLQEILLAVEPGLKFTTYQVHNGQLPLSPEDCDAFISTGSRYGANDGFPWIEDLETFIRQLDAATKKFVGICFGHQVMAKALGGEVEKSPKGWGVGVSYNDIIHRQEWMTPYQESIDLVVSHQDQICSLPQDVKVLARSEFCEYYMLQKGRPYPDCSRTP